MRKPAYWLALTFIALCGCQKEEPAKRQIDEFDRQRLCLELALLLNRTIDDLECQLLFDDLH